MVNGKLINTIEVVHFLGKCHSVHSRSLHVYYSEQVPQFYAQFNRPESCATHHVKNEGNNQLLHELR